MLEEEHKAHKVQEEGFKETKEIKSVKREQLRIQKSLYMRIVLDRVEKAMMTSDSKIGCI